jgi:thiamine biosynthesis protein ThiI
MNPLFHLNDIIFNYPSPQLSYYSPFLLVLPFHGYPLGSIMQNELGTAVIVRYSEVAVKGYQTRKRMEKLLYESISEALSRFQVNYDKIEVTQGRILVWNPENPNRAAEVVARVFGVKSTSPSVAFKFESIDDIVRYGVEFFADKVRGRVFRVRARRVGAHEFTSKDVERELGAKLLEAGARGVNLEAPEYTAYVEIRQDNVFLYDRVIEGPGGLPLGSEEPVLVLYSGGFYSTVASWMIMRRGAPVGLALYNLGVEEAVRQAVETARYIAENWVFYGTLNLFIVNFSNIINIIRETVLPEYRLLILRRLMMEHACNLAQQHKYEALATGESIGQVASQTVRNIRLIGSNLCLPVLRPLAGLDKDDVVRYAIKIGVYELVSKHVEACRGKPVPRSSPRIFYKMLENARERMGDSLQNIPVKTIILP